MAVTGTTYKQIVLGSFSAIVPIMVDITNINDIIPLFSSNQLEFVIKENF